MHTYTFSATKLRLLIACLVLLQVLTFSAGLFTGVGLWSPAQAEIAELKKARGEQPVTARSKVRALMPGSVSEAQSLVSDPAGAASTAATTAATNAANNALAAKPAGEAPAAAPATAAPAAAAPATAAPQAPTPVVTASAPAGAQPSALAGLAPKNADVRESPNLPTSGYVLTVGSFRDAKNAAQIVAELKGKGYNPLIRRTVDSSDQTWHVVQVGPYADLPAAVKAARDFNTATSVHAFIRRVEN